MEKKLSDKLEKYEKEQEGLEGLEGLKEFLKGYKEININNTKNSIDQNINFSVHNSDKLVELLNEKEVYVSTKSACSSSESLSKAIMAVYNNEKRAESSIRISLSYKTTKKDIKKFKKIFDYCYRNKGE